MRELVFLEPRKLEWREVPEPRIEHPEDAIVRPISATTCDLDTAIIRGQRRSKARLPLAMNASPKSPMSARVPRNFIGAARHRELTHLLRALLSLRAAAVAEHMFALSKRSRLRLAGSGTVGRNVL